MEIPSSYQKPPADPQLVDQIVNKIKSAGTFDQWRRECLADVDTKPAYQNLTFRVDNAVASFLGRQRWRPDMAKNQVRENLRRHILDLGIIEKGVDRIVEQVVQPKVLPTFHPAVEDAIYTFLGIERPQKKEPSKNGNSSFNSGDQSTSPNKRAFKPLPVSVPNREKEAGVTPPPGEEDFELEAITPSPPGAGGLADEVSDVSMEDAISHPPGEPLDRICSPISQSDYSSHPPGESRVASALSVISSGDDLPSSSGAPSPIGRLERLESVVPPLIPIDEERPQSASSSIPGESENEDEDESDEFSSPEFEKLDIIPPTSRTVTPVPGEEPYDDIERRMADITDDHNDLRPKTESREPDRKPDEDQGPSTAPQEPPLSGPSQSSDRVPSSEKSADNNKSSSDRPKSSTSSSKDKDTHRSRSSSHHKSRKDKERDREREREREKEKRRRDKESSDHRKHHRSERHRSRERDERKKSSSHHKSSDRSDKERREKSNADRHRSGSSSVNKKKERPARSPSPPPHPKAHLWERPAERSTALWDYLAKFPAEVFQDGDEYGGNLSDVSVSSVSSYADSDAESVIRICLSEVEIDSDLEQLLESTGGRITYLDTSVKEEEILEPLAEVAPLNTSRARSSLSESLGNQDPSPSGGGGHSKRVRKVNTRYSDSYVGSEFRKIITQHSSDQYCSSSSSPLPTPNPANDSLPESTETSPEEQQEVIEEEDVDSPAPDVKRLKTELLPSSPESVLSDPSNAPLLPAVSSSPAPSGEESTFPVNRRRSAAVKQPQQRYDNTDLYKPRPVITPSTRRSRRPDDT